MSTYERPKPAPDPLIGLTLHGRYKVEKRIGKGGMGIVYLAEHVLLRRKVALKVLSDRAFASEELIARFHREAVAAASVGSEHIVDVLDMDRLDDGSYFVVLEFLDGVELAHAVEEQGPLPLERALRIVLQLCDALTAVHRNGIVHRDLKPENLFLIEREGVADFVKVLDFGVCKVLDNTQPGGGALTQTGESLGTPLYMAPEQVESSARVDARADVYATAAILYYALAGQPPFDEPLLPRLLMRICSESPPSIRGLRPELPAALDTVLARALHKLPEARFASAAELRAALEPFAAGATAATAGASAAPERSAPVGQDPTVSLTLSQIPRRNLRRYALAGALLLAGVLLIAALWPHADAKTPPRAADPAPVAANAAEPPGRASGLDLVLEAEGESGAGEAPARAAVEGPVLDRTGAARGPSAPAAADRNALAPRAQQRRSGAPTGDPHASGSRTDAPAGQAPLAADVGAVPAPAAAPSIADTAAPEDAKPQTTYRISQRELKDVF